MPLIKVEKDSLQKALDSTDYKDVFPGLPKSSFAQQVQNLLLIDEPEDIFEFINEKLSLDSTPEEEKNKLKTFMEEECPLLFDKFADNSLKNNFLLSMLRAGVPATAKIINIDHDLMKKINKTAKVKIGVANQNIEDIKKLYGMRAAIHDNFNSNDNIDNTVIGCNLDRLNKKEDVDYFLKRLAEKRPNATLKQEIDDFFHVVNNLNKFDNSVKEIVRKALPKVFRKKLKHFNDIDGYERIYNFLAYVPNIFNPDEQEDVKQFKRCFNAIIEKITTNNITDFLHFLSNNNNKDSIKLLESCLSFADILNNKFPTTDNKAQNNTFASILKWCIKNFFKAKNNILIQTGKENTDEQKEVQNILDQLNTNPDLFSLECDLGDLKDFLIRKLDVNRLKWLCDKTTNTISFPEPLKVENKDVALAWLRNEDIGMDKLICVPLESYIKATTNRDNNKRTFAFYDTNSKTTNNIEFNVEFECYTANSSQRKKIPENILKKYSQADDNVKDEIKKKLIPGIDNNEPINHYQNSINITNIFPWLKDFEILTNNEALMYKYLVENVNLNEEEKNALSEKIKEYNETLPFSKDLFTQIEDGQKSKAEHEENIEKAKQNLQKIDSMMKIIQLNHNAKDDQNEAFQSLSLQTTQILLQSKATMEKAKFEIEKLYFNTLKNSSKCFTTQEDFDNAITNINIALNEVKEAIDKNINKKFSNLAMQISDDKIKDEERVKKQLKNIEAAKNNIQILLHEDKNGENLQVITNNYIALINSIDNFDFTPKTDRFKDLGFQEKLNNQLQIEQESIEKQIKTIANDQTLNDEQKNELINKIQNVEQNLFENYSNVFKASNEINSKATQKNVENLMKRTNEIKKDDLKQIKVFTKQEKEKDKLDMISNQSINDIQNLRNVIDKVNEENQQVLDQQAEKKNIILTDDANKYAKNIKNPEDAGWFYDTTNQILGFASPIIATGTIAGAILLPVATIPIAIVGGVLSLLGFSTFIYRKSEKNKEIKIERFEEKIKIQEDALKDKIPYSNGNKNIGNSTDNNLNTQNSIQNNNSITPA